MGGRTKLTNFTKLSGLRFNKFVFFVKFVAHKEKKPDEGFQMKDFMEGKARGIPPQQVQPHLVRSQNIQQSNQGFGFSIGCPRVTPPFIMIGNGMKEMR